MLVKKNKKNKFILFGSFNSRHGVNGARKFSEIKVQITFTFKDGAY